MSEQDKDGAANQEGSAVQNVEAPEEGEVDVDNAGDAGEVENEEGRDASEEVLSYREVSEMSEITQESYPEGYVVSHAATAAVEDLVDFEKLKS